MKRHTSIILGVLVVLVALENAYQLVRLNQPPPIDYTSASRTVHSPVRNGLELTATIKEVLLPIGQNLTMVEEVNNTLSILLKVNARSMDNPAHGPCQQAFATGIQVFSGNFTYLEL